MVLGHHGDGMHFGGERILQRALASLAALIATNFSPTAFEHSLEKNMIFADVFTFS